MTRLYLETPERKKKKHIHTWHPLAYAISTASNIFMSHTHTHLDLERDRESSKYTNKHTCTHTFPLRVRWQVLGMRVA